MDTQIHIMNLDVDLLTEESLQESLEEYLTNDYLNVVHLISTEYIDENNENEMMESVLKDADLVLPGEKAILTKHHVDVLEAGEMVVNYKNFMNVLNKIGLHEKRYYFIMRTKHEAKSFYRIVQSADRGCECVGIYTADSRVTDEALINDINTQVPDIIYLSLDREVQEQWISEHKGKLNAKLCICLGSIMSLIHRENPNIPRWIQILRIGELYKKLVKIPVSHFFRERIFRKKMANYNSKKSPRT